MRKQVRLSGILLTLTLFLICLVTPVTAQAAVKKSVKITSIKSNTSVYVGTAKSLGIKVNAKSSVTYKISKFKDCEGAQGEALYLYSGQSQDND